MDIQPGHQKNETLGKYKILNTLGKGISGIVKIGEKNGELFALKIFHPERLTSRNLKEQSQEVKALLKLKHPNVINMIEYHKAFRYKSQDGQEGSRICIVYELAQRGEFYDFIENNGLLGSDVTRFYFIQLLNALIYMRDQGICHRDLKMDNILMDNDFNLKIADFGFSTNITRGQLKTKCGTNGYMAPEIESKKDYDGTKADVFSLGVILFIMFTKRPPFGQAQLGDEYYSLFKNKINTFWKYNENWSKRDDIIIPEDFKNLIESMLSEDLNKRFTYEQCLNHPWTQGPILTQEQFFNKMIKLTEKNHLQQTEKGPQQILQQNQINKHPIGKFKCQGNVGIDFTDVENKYNLTNNSRKLKLYPESGMLNEIYCFREPDLIFCHLLKQCDQFESKVNKIYEGKYKIRFDIYDKGEKTGELDVQLNQIQGKNLNKIRIKVFNQGIDYFVFHQRVCQIKQFIQTI